MTITDHYHCCASCQHFQILRIDGKNVSRCSRLGYETQPSYKFDCWDPKSRVRRALEKKLNDNKLR